MTIDEIMSILLQCENKSEMQKKLIRTDQSARTVTRKMTRANKSPKDIIKVERTTMHKVSKAKAESTKEEINETLSL